MTLKLNRADLIRPQAEDAIDKHFARLIAAEIGPLGALHALKRSQAIAGNGALLDGDREAILTRAADQDGRLAEIDRRRRAMKAAVQDAVSSAEIRATLAELK